MFLCKIWIFSYWVLLLLFLIQVHIPCINDKQWILIVANFIDKSFDVLNPHSSLEKFSSIVSTVIFNFKELFSVCYPGCWKFNIREFTVKHVPVPKHNFRYESQTTHLKSFSPFQTVILNIINYVHFSKQTDMIQASL
jgi:hypothetical protein